MSAGTSKVRACMDVFHYHFFRIQWPLFVNKLYNSLFNMYVEPWFLQGFTAIIEFLKCNSSKSLEYISIVYLLPI